MNLDGHREKAKRLERIRAKLDDRDDFELVVEACYMAAIQYIALVSETRKKRHVDTHKGLPKFLDDHGMSDLSAAFCQLEILRAGKYYGGQGNGKSAKEAKGILEDIKEKLH